jgi:acetyl esterase/lipase
MPGIMADIKACMDYLRSPAFAKETGPRVDQSKIIVSGGSAGGWLALLLATGIGFEACGLIAPEPPLAVVPLYPMTDITDSFFLTKQHRE